VTLSEIVTDLNSVVANKQIDVHLHWSEYLRGEWSTRESGGFSPLISVTVAASFVPSSVFIHVSKEDAADGAERGVFINLGGEVNRGFYLAGRNSAPESASYWSTPANPFNSANTALATRYSGSGELKVIYGERISNEPGKTPPKANPSVLQGSLQSGGSYTILPCNLGISREAFRQPHRVVEDFGYDAGGWRVDKHPRFLADLTGDGRADIVGFANDGVCVALNNGDGTFQAPKWVVKNDFGYGSGAGGWRVDKHPRFLADLTGDGRADIVGFGDDGVYVTLNKGDGTFRVPKQVVRNNFGYGSGAGGWRVDKHPRFLADLTGDGRADIVGFGDDGVYVALNKGDGTFRVPKQVVRNNFGYGSGAGGWRVENHPRFLADLTGDGRADIVGFGDDGVYVALNNGNGTFQAPSLVVQNFGHVAGVWRVENHPRFLADLTGNGCADIVGFANAGVYVALNKGDGTFEEPRRVVEDFGYAGGWRVEDHPRFLADLTGDGRADIVGFANAGVYVALNNGDGTFQAPRRVVEDFGYDTGGWCAEMHPRCVADLTGAGGADIVGFANEGVCVALNDGALDSRVNEIASLVKPVFYQDNQHSFFVEPEVVEQTIDEWDEWVTRTTQLEPRWKVPTISIITAIPHAWAIRGQGDPWVVPIDPRSLINSPLDRDWLLNPSSAMTFNNVLIGPKGQAGIEIQFAGDLAVGRRLANANPGGNLTAGSSVVLRDEKSFASSGLRAVGGGLNIVGSAGFSSALEQNFNNLKRFDFGAGAPLSARRNTR
jgi:hypothetical protein